jgi:uncharacterized protein (TIGR01440 family)
MLEEYKLEAAQAARELLAAAKLRKGDILVVGCSSSEITAHRIGSFSNAEIGIAVFEGIYEVAKAQGIYLAAQCCEHLNRSLIIEQEAADAYRLECVNVVPQPKAGGSFATAAYYGFAHPAVAEEVRAHAGIDIGDTLIGMHLRKVAVPVRINQKKVGEARVVCARTRLKFVGGERARYNTELM